MYPFKLFTLAFLTFAALACGSKKQLTAEESTNLARLQGNWRLVQMEGRAADPDRPLPQLEFDTQTGRLYGSEGCRAIGGTLEARNQLMSIADLQTREEDCSIQGSSRFVENLKQVNGYRLEGNQLVLLQGQSELLRFERVK